MSESRLPDGFEIFWATPEVAVGAMPCKPEHLEMLKRDGVRGVLNLCAEFCDLADIERESGFAVHFLAIDDMDAPDPAALELALDWLDNLLAAGGKAFIHCRFGMGRTGTVLACWLLRTGLSPEACGQAVAGFRATPQSAAQRRFVKDYAESRCGPAPPNGLRRAINACLTRLRW